MQSINDILSDELKVTPLREGEQVEFRLILFGKYNPQLKGPNAPALRGLAGRCDINDPFDKARPIKQIVNIESLQPVVLPGQQQSFNIVTAPIMFPASGGIICTHLDNNKYMYLKRHNKNIDNPYRNKRKEAVFFEVDEKKDLKKQNALFEYKALSGYELVKATDAQIAQIALNFNKLSKNHNKSLQIDISQSTESILKNLQALSQTNPAELILSMEIDELVARVMVDMAVDQRWILFDSHPEKNRWIWMRTPGQKGAQNILEVDPAQTDINKALATFLTTEKGSIHFAELKMRHAQYYAAKTA